MIQPFQFPYRSSLSAREYEEEGGKWEPQLHFTGVLDDPVEIRFIEHLLKKYGEAVVAHYIYSPWPETYSVELQFGSSDEAKRKQSDCRNEYHAAFTCNGNLKKKIAEQFAINRGNFRLIAVRPAMPPEVVAIDRGDVADMITEIVDGYWEVVHYPAHLNLPLTVIGNEDGLMHGLAYNRWGIVGGFVVTRYSSNGSSHLSLTDKQIQQAMIDLEDVEDGYLNPSSNLVNALREPFAMHGIAPSGWVPAAGKWFD